jgi:hypothetical protein
MRRARKRFACISVVALTFGVSATAYADCGLDVNALMASLATAQAQFQRSNETAEKSRANVVSTYARLDTAIAAVSSARATNNEPTLARAIAELSQTKKQYDQAVAAERPMLVARIEADRVLRGARQALTDAVNILSEQAQALIRASERARRGEVAPSLSDALVCEQSDCVKVSAVEHAAILALGAVPESLDMRAGIASERACDFTLMKSLPQTVLVRELRQAQAEAQTQLQAAEAGLVSARQTLSAVIPAWDKSIAETLDTFNSPVGNSHADELLGMAIEELRKQDQAFDAVTAPYRKADEAVMRARTKAITANESLKRHLDYWSDVGRAVADAAAKAERGQSPKFVGVCMAANPAQPGAWVFPLSPPPNC